MINNLIIAFLFSFLGSIPPGTLNLSVLQLSIDQKINAAIRFCIAAAIVEIPYAYIAIKFQSIIVSSPFMMDNLNIIASVVMITLGSFNIYAAKNSTGITTQFKDSGFRKGVILSILNPLAIPFWIGVSTYLVSIDWVILESEWLIGWFVTGVSLGTFGLLFLIVILGKKVAPLFRKKEIIHIIPGIIFILMGLYSSYQYFISI